ncbi:hypothetical protein [Roseovarius sp. D0-M9]|uniref:hypothetical protein n=1 Tax=Roseovarius sp. D0-M9 TaxID=3127117 RepID=UPI003FA7C968
MARIGVEVSQRLDVVSAQLRVLIERNHITILRAIRDQSGLPPSVIALHASGLRLRARFVRQRIVFCSILTR